MYYIDKINLFSFLKILNLGINKLYLLEGSSPNFMVRAALFFFRIEVIEVDFFAGNLRDESGESVSFAATKLANKIALILAQERINAISEIEFIYKFLKKEVVVLNYAKKILPEILSFLLPLEIIKSLSKDPTSIIIRRSCEIDCEALSKYYPKINIYFYDDFLLKCKIILRILGIYIYKGFFRFIFSRNASCFDVRPNQPTNSILTIQTNTINIDKSFRGQPYWRSMNGPISDYPIYVLGENFHYAKGLDRKAANKLNIYPIEITNFKKIFAKFNRNVIIIELKKIRKKLLYSINSKNFILILRILTLVRNAELISVLFLSLSVRVFVNEEPYYDYSDAIEAISDRLKVKTIGYQYSNLSAISVAMLSNSDYFFTFSNLYSKIYHINGMGPKNIVPNGYPYNFNNELIRERANQLRIKLFNSGATFVICYLDERVDHNKWGTIDGKRHYQELAELMRYILANKNMALIVKSQFYRYSPSMWYKNDDLISEAIKSERYFELASGKIGTRNDIFPAEAAHVSDICISHKFGGTAALEAALCGKRVVLLNSVTYNSDFDDIYKMANIERPSIQAVIESINQMRVAKPGDINANFGDWTKILKYFNHNEDANSSNRIENAIYKYLS